MQTIGERLEDARKRKGISIREAAEATKIRGDYLQRFESNQFDLGLAEIYVKGFLRSYSHFLGLPADRIINDFNGLGSAAASRPRTPGREVYGRMDLSAATADEAGPKDSAASASPEPTPNPVRRGPTAFSRGGGNLHHGPKIDPALVLKITVAVAGVVLLLLIVWGIKSLVLDGRSKSPAATAPEPVSVVQTAPAETLTLVALDQVHVTVVVKNPDLSDGQQLFDGTLRRGQTQVVPKPGPVYITVSLAQNLEVEYRGVRHPMPRTGVQPNGKYWKIEFP
jgi:cytoskeleton protein RodZ